MSAVEEIKAAVGRLRVEDQFELFKWLGASAALAPLCQEELKREIALGLQQADSGEVAPLDVEAAKAEGRRRLAQEH